MFSFGDQVDPKIAKRREVLFMIFAGIFLGSLTMLNILGVSRFVDLSFTIGDMKVPFSFAVGVLAYPITFLCTDFISELYGKERANMLVWVGLILNCWVLFVLWLGGVLPPNDHVNLTGAMAGIPDLPTESTWQSSDWAFWRVKQLTFGAVTASMIAYLTAQFVDVHVFHFLKKLTKGKHLWIRNNFSTLASQLVDSVAVIMITHFATHSIPVDNSLPILPQLMVFILSTYVFKMASALLDTIPFYFGVKFFTNYLQIDPNKEFKEEQAVS